jgi:hypothetical protein
MRTIVSVLVYSLALGACGQSNDATGERATSAEAPAPAKRSGLVAADVRTRCAGFGAAQAAEFLGVPASAIAERMEDTTPTARGCQFEAGEKRILYWVSVDDSVEEAERELANLREGYVMSARAQEHTTGKALEQGAYSDILALGDEAIWSATNDTLAVRHKNLRIQVMAPNDKRAQVAVARKILEGVP